MTGENIMTERKHATRSSVKCVVWDLDHTVWDGILLEDREVALRPGVRQTLAALDERGLLHSVASRNDPETALAKLTELGIAEFFLHPQIGWDAKSHSIGAVAEALNIGVDALAFVDDQPFERDEVRHVHPQITVIDAAAVTDLLVRPEFIPRFITDDSRRRREMYRADERRNADEDGFTGPQEEFLASLDMRFEITTARETDLQRAEELTVRTNQLNTTGITYSYEELERFRTADDHLLLIARLTDRYGPYGNIGVALVEIGESGTWTVKLLLMSCRVMSRGVGSVLVNHLRRRARDAGVELAAEFVPTGRNRPMLVSFKFNGFSEVSRDGDRVLFRADLDAVPDDPDHLEVTVS